MRMWSLKDFAYRVLRSWSQTDLNLTLTLSRHEGSGDIFLNALRLGFPICKMGLKQNLPRKLVGN